MRLRIADGLDQEIRSLIVMGFPRGVWKEQDPFGKTKRSFVHSIGPPTNREGYSEQDWACGVKKNPPISSEGFSLM